MKHPVRDRLIMLLCALVALCGVAAVVALIMGVLSVDAHVSVLVAQLGALLASVKGKVILAAVAAVLLLIALLLLGAILPGKKKRSSTFAIQRNENGMVRISLKALETLVQKCLNQHAELKVVTSSLFSDEESVRVDVHINMQTDISMPLAISALQKQIKKYLEACSGVQIQEVRIFVEGMMPATEDTANSPYALPMTLLCGEGEALTEAQEPAVEAMPVAEEAPAEEAVQEEAAPVEQEPAVEEAVETPAEETEAAEEATEDVTQEQGE